MSKPAGLAGELERLRHFVDIARRHRQHALQQARLLREIEHLRETARMLFEDKPDKTKAVEAVNDIAERKAARLDHAARALLLDNDRIPVAEDRGDRWLWTLRINRAGHFPYTMGIGAHEEPPGGGAAAVEENAWPAAAVQQLAAALADGWGRLVGSADGGAPTPEIAFNEHRDAANQALASAARRLWAVVARDGFGAHGATLLLRLQDPPGATTDGTTRSLHALQAAAIDAAEDRLLEALLRLPARASDSP